MYVINKTDKFSTHAPSCVDQNLLTYKSNKRTKELNLQQKHSPLVPLTKTGRRALAHDHQSLLHQPRQLLHFHRLLNQIT
jgi:hypothetical protein